MRSIFDPLIETAVRERAARLTPGSSARWGRMQPAQMLCHLVDALRLPLGESSARPKWTPFRIFPVRWLFIHLLPWPKGKVQTLPEFQQTQPGQFDEDQQAWSTVLSRFVARGRQPNPAWKPHPAFGALPNWEWGLLVYRHIDHHFQQFGL